MASKNYIKTTELTKLTVKHQGLVPVSHKNIIYPAVGKKQTAKGGVLYGGECSAVGYKSIAEKV